MKYLYLLLNLGSILIPFLFSFNPKLKFYQYWKALFLAVLTTMLIFIPWDVLFTVNGIWGFNDTYFIGIKIFSLPIEEWLFFICIPYACVFTHYALVNLLPNLSINKKASGAVTISLNVLLISLSILNYDKWYTLINFMYATILIVLVKTYQPEILRRYYFTFLVMLIPFFIVNGILTGCFIENEVVWYNINENLNFRLFTIPIEDTIYAFSLILTNLVLTNYFHKKLN